jgi:hypothetical protein
MDDPTRKRREYVWKQLVTLGVAGAAAILTVSGVLVAAVMWLWIHVYLNYYAMGHFRDSREKADTYVQTLIIVVLSWLAVGLVSGFIWRDQVAKSQKIERVPPVAEQIAALPAQEVLLRSSSQSDATPEELLRAASAGAETEAEELLRAESGGAGRQGPA